MEFMDCTLHVLSGQFCGSSCNNDKKGGGGHWIVSLLTCTLYLR